jgi:hypothetical protein
MTTGRPERAAELVIRWTRWYTRRLPAPIAGRRLEEIRADLHDHLAFERARGVPDRLITASVLSRMLRGLPADAVWRHRMRPPGGETMRPFAAVIAVALLAVAVGVAAGVYGERDDAPGLFLIGIVIIAVASALTVRSAIRRSKGGGR